MGNNPPLPARYAPSRLSWFDQISTGSSAGSSHENASFAGAESGRVRRRGNFAVACFTSFPVQIEALNRYRSHGEPANTVQNVSVRDGGKAIVGNVTQHASVIVSDKKAASAARKAPKNSGSKRRHADADAKRQAQA